MSATPASATSNQERLVSKTVRVSVIGEEGCGKSTFVQQFVTGQSKLSKSAITFEIERTLSSRIIKRDGSSVTRYDVHVNDTCASPVTNFMALENASTADFVLICFDMYGGNINVLFQVILDLFKVCHAASRPRPPFMLVGLNKTWDKSKTRDKTSKDSKSIPVKPSENLATIVSKILDMFQCKLSFVVLHNDPESENSGKQNTGNQNSGNQAAAAMPPGTVTAVEVFSRAMDEYEFARNEPIRSSVSDSSVYRLYYNAQNGGLACTLKKQWTLDTNVEVFIFPVFIGIGILACNLSETPPKIFEVTQLCCLDLSDNPLSRLSDGFSTLPRLSVLNASNSKLSVEPAILVACTSLTDLNLSRNSFSNASCLLKCASLIRLDISENVCPVIMEGTGADCKLSALTHLNLSKTACTSFDFIGSLVSITNMNLRGTGIRDGSLSFLSQLACLRYLDVCGNKLSEIAIPVFLETALVDNNELKYFEISCFTSSPHRLNTLSLKNNKLTELPKQIWQLVSLQNISFAGNNIPMLDFYFASCGSRIV